jgi:hypothetical protein
MRTEGRVTSACITARPMIGCCECEIARMVGKRSCAVLWYAVRALSLPTCDGTCKSTGLKRSCFLARPRSAVRMRSQPAAKAPRSAHRCRNASSQMPYLYCRYHERRTRRSTAAAAACRFLLCKHEECDDNAAGDGKWKIGDLGLTHTEVNLS